MTKPDLEALSAPEPETPAMIGGMQPTTVSEIVFNYNFLVFGDYGIGKTTLAGSSIEVDDLSPVLFLDIEGGALAIKSRYPDVHVLRITEPGELKRIYQDLRKQAAKGELKYKTIIVDSVTELHKLELRYIMLDVMENDDKGNRDEDVPGMQEYLKATERIRRVCRRFRDLPVSVIFTALLTEEQDDKKNRTYKKIALTRKLSTEIGGFFDVVLYMYMKENEGKQTRLLLSTRTEEIAAKDRTDTLPNILIEPNMEKIFQYITGEKVRNSEGRPE